MLSHHINQSLHSVRSTETEEGESMPASMSAVLDQKNYIEELNRHLK